MREAGVAGGWPTSFQGRLQHSASGLFLLRLSYRGGGVTGHQANLLWMSTDIDVVTMATITLNLRIKPIL